MKYLINAVRGFCMALADSVPGVSGGTIAFVLGFYDEFINALDRLVYGNGKEKKKAILFLIKLGIGWVIGMIAAILVLTGLFESNIYSVSSLFMGFIVLAIPFIIKEEKDVLKGKYRNLIFTLIGIVIVSLITYFNPVSGGDSVNIMHLDIGLGIYIFVAGMIAISAMILPGISGSTLLLIFGLYIPVMNGVKEILHMNFETLPSIIVFGLGVITGIVVIIKLVKVSLEKWRSQVIYLIIGLMIGSVYAIIMGPMTLDEPKAPLSLETFSLLFFVLGAIVIIGLEQLRKVMDKKMIEKK